MISVEYEQLKWDSMLKDETCGIPAQVERLQNLYWAELGILESGVENIQLRRASLPPGRSGLWTSDGLLGSSSSSSTARKNSSALPSLDDNDVQSTGSASATLADCALSDEVESVASTTSESVAEGVQQRLPYRRESLPFNFPDRSVKELRLGRRESLPTRVAESSRTLSADDILPELNITSIAPRPGPGPGPIPGSLRLSAKKEKKTTSFAPNCINMATTTSIPSSSTTSSSSSRKDFTCNDEKENIQSNGIFKSVRSFFFFLHRNQFFLQHLTLINQILM